MRLLRKYTAMRSIGAVLFPITAAAMSTGRGSAFRTLPRKTMSCRSLKDPQDALTPVSSFRTGVLSERSIIQDIIPSAMIPLQGSSCLYMMQRTKRRIWLPMFPAARSCPEIRRSFPRPGSTSAKPRGCCLKTRISSVPSLMTDRWKHMLQTGRRGLFSGIRTSAHGISAAAKPYGRTYLRKNLSGTRIRSMMYTGC